MSLDATFEILFPFKQFEVERILGKLASGRAVSWIGRSYETKERVVIKELNRADSSDHQVWIQHQRDGWATIHELRRGQDSALVIRDFVEGESLSFKNAAGGLHEALALMQAVCGFLAPLHDIGMVHGRLKPTNIIVDGATSPILTDPSFENSKVNIDSVGGETIDAAVSFDVHYVSPEQIRGEMATPASDVYSLGCILYMLLAGRPPFAAGAPVMTCSQHLMAPPPDPARLGANLPRDARNLLFMMLAKSPKERPAGAQELLTLLEPLADPDFAPAAMTGTFVFSANDLLPRSDLRPTPEPEPVKSKRPAAPIPPAAKLPDPPAPVATNGNAQSAEPNPGTLIISRNELRRLIQNADLKRHSSGEIALPPAEERIPIPLVRSSAPKSQPAKQKDPTTELDLPLLGSVESEAPTEIMPRVSPSAENPQQRPANSKAQGKSGPSALVLYSIGVTALLVVALTIIIVLLLVSGS